MEYLYLADRPEAIATIAKWYFDEWGYLGAGSDAGEVAHKIRIYLNRDKIPLILMAVDQEEVLGVVQLKYREMDIYPDKEHWLGGVFVPEKHRGKGIAAAIIHKALEVAKSLNVERLYLQTQDPDGGLYQTLGWRPLEQVNYHGIDVLVMERQI